MLDPKISFGSQLSPQKFSAGSRGLPATTNYLNYEGFYGGGGIFRVEIKDQASKNVT